MIISYRWLLEYLPEPLPVNDLSDILTSIGLEVEAVELSEGVKGGLRGLVTGEVLTCVKHPNADKLSLTTVDVGGEKPLQIVCGAPNVAAGLKVIVAVEGTTVHPIEGEPFLIKRSKIRGEYSEGMICAEDEIGLGSSHAGIMILPVDTAVGVDAPSYFSIPEPDHAIHIGLTPNRSDANSHIGVARDVCAWLSHHRGKSYRVVMPVNDSKVQTAGSNPITITIDAPEACPRYAGVLVKGIKVGASPDWLQARLQTIGVRSINNIVDVTNYVLHEFGQPLHAFDADKLSGNHISVGFRPEGTAFVALDDKERKLSGDDLMINDAAGPIAIGGVFGGGDSGVSDTTTDVFIESAYFTPAYIRRTSLRHDLRTDAATHFEKGVDVNAVIPAMLRAAAMIAELGGAMSMSQVADVYPQPVQNVEIDFTYEYINKLAGKQYVPASVKEILVALGFSLLKESDEGLRVAVPGNKPDVRLPADIVEEVLRIDGLDNVVIPDRLNISLSRPLPGDRAHRNRFAGLLCGMGFREIITNSITNSRYYPDRTDLVHMINSLSSELDVMRPAMLESGLEVVAYNCNRKSKDLALYEFGNIYGADNGKYAQSARVGLWLSGNITGAGWQSKSQPSGIYYLKGLLKNLASHAGLEDMGETVSADGQVQYLLKRQLLATVSAVSADRLKLFDIKQDVYFAEIHWDEWVAAMERVAVRFAGVPRFPTVERDLAIVLDKQISYGEVEQVTKSLKMPELRNFGLFDVFEGEQLGAGKRSLALNFTFRLDDRTLTDAETEKLMTTIAGAYKSKLNALIRE